MDWLRTAGSTTAAPATYPLGYQIESKGTAVAAGNVFVTGRFVGTAFFAGSTAAPPTTLTNKVTCDQSISLANINMCFDIFRAAYSTGTSGATHFAFSASPQSAVAGSPFTFMLTALDQFNNPVPSYNGTVHFTSSDGNSSTRLPDDITFASATATGLSATLVTAGTQTITATDTTIRSITGTSSITVNPGAATGFDFSNLPQAPPVAGKTFTVTVTAHDAFGNRATNYPGIVWVHDNSSTLNSGTLTNGQGDFSGNLTHAGAQFLYAQQGFDVFNPLLESKTLITVLADVVDHFSIGTLQTSVAGGTKVNFNLTAQDKYTNFVNSYSGTVHITASDGNSIFFPPDVAVANGSGSFSVVLNAAGSWTITGAANGILGSARPVQVTSTATPTPVGSPVGPITPTDLNGNPQPITLTFPNVNSPGGTNAVPTSIAPPANFKLSTGSLIYDITTTAKYTTPPPITVCFTGNFKSSDSIQHFENGSWVNLQPATLLPSGGPYTQICGDTNSLSPFGVFTPANNPPSANAGTNQTLEATGPSGAIVSLSGTGSDPDDDPLTFSWSGPCGSASGANISLTCPLGTSTMMLTVNDGRGGSATPTVQITVRDTTPPSIVCAAPDTAWHPTDVTISCSASDLVGLLNPADASFVLSTSVSAGAETATATTGSRSVCDSSNNCATAGPIGPIKVDKKPPSIAIDAPANNATYVLNQPLAASFSCSDTGAGIANCNAPIANGATSTPVPSAAGVSL